MNLFDELCKDAKTDIESGVFLQGDPTKGDNAELNKRVDEVEKKMTEALNEAMSKITQASQPVEPNVPGDNQPTENIINNEEKGTNANDNN